MYLCYPIKSFNKNIFLSAQQAGLWLLGKKWKRLKEGNKKDHSAFNIYSYGILLRLLVAKQGPLLEILEFERMVSKYNLQK